MRIIGIATLVLFVCSKPVSAYLGGFEPGDGYVVVNSHLKESPPKPDYDVAKYNAGQFGANVDPTATYSQSNPSAWLWSKTSGTLIPSNTNTSPAYTYATGHDVANSPPYYVLTPHSGARALVITTNNADMGKLPGTLWTGPAQSYAYRIDAHDLDGMNPALTGSQRLQISFWSCSQLWGIDEMGGLGAGSIGNTIAFKDSKGMVGLELGYTQPQTTSDFAWTSLGGETKVPIDVHTWHRWDVDLDLVTDRVSVKFTPELPSGALGPTTTILSSAKLSTAMDSLAEFEFTSTAGINNAKFWALDDFELCVTEAPLSDLLNGGTLWSGDKQFSEFDYHGGGDMPDAEDIFVKTITDADGNFGIRFQGAFVDAVDGGASDALIDYKVTAPEGKLIKDVHLGANPLVIGGDDKMGLASITETFLSDNSEIVLSAFDIEPGSRQLTDWADLVDENGDLAPVKELNVQKDIILWAQQLGSAPTLSFLDQTFSQCDEDPMIPGQCVIDTGGDGPPGDDSPALLAAEMAGDFNRDGTVDAADFTVWRDSLGGKFSQADFNAWTANFGRMSSANATLLRAAVPEPASAALLMLGIVGFFGTRPVGRHARLATARIVI